MLAVAGIAGAPPKSPNPAPLGQPLQAPSSSANPANASACALLISPPGGQPPGGATILSSTQVSPR